jgi:hypothetical protein
LQSRLAWVNSQTVPKITKAKRDKGFTQVVEHLPSKLKALSSSPSTEGEKKQKTK